MNKTIKEWEKELYYITWDYCNKEFVLELLSDFKTIHKLYRIINEQYNLLCQSCIHELSLISNDDILLNHLNERLNSLNNSTKEF